MVDTILAYAEFIRKNETALRRRLLADPPPLVTTTLVVAEGHAWFLRRYDRTRASQFLTMIEDITPLTVIPVGSEEQRDAVALLRRFNDQDLTMTDAVGLSARRLTGSAPAGPPTFTWV